MMPDNHWRMTCRR